MPLLTGKMWRNFVFLQKFLFSWEVFTVISRKILFFWEKCHFEKNPIFFRKRQDFLIYIMFTVPVHSTSNSDYSFLNYEKKNSPTPKNYTDTPHAYQNTHTKFHWNPFRRFWDNVYNSSASQTSSDRQTDHIKC